MKRKLNLCCLFAALYLAFAPDAFAAARGSSGFPLDGLSADSRGAEIEVTADQSLEWHRDKKAFLARGNARAVKGDITIEADILAAFMREEGADNLKSGSEEAPILSSSGIEKFTAEGNVRIYNSSHWIYGDYAVYDFDRKLAKITGTDIKYVSGHDTVTAKQALEYHEDKRTAVARGHAVARQDGGKSRVEADILTAQFEPNPRGQLEMSKMSAEGNVVVITGKDVARGDRAVYDVKKNVAVLKGNVRITRDNTQLSGTAAEVNFANGKSRIVNEGKGRVRALLSTKQIKEKSANSKIKSGETTVKEAK